MSQTESSTVYRVQCTALQQPAACSTAVEGSFILFVDIAAAPPHCSTAALQPHRDLGHRELLGYCISRALQRCSMWAVVQGCCSAAVSCSCSVTHLTLPAQLQRPGHPTCAAVLQCCSHSAAHWYSERAPSWPTRDGHFKLILNILLKNIKNLCLCI